MKVHFTLQGKGGVAKTVIAGYIAQYYLDRGEQVLAINTDPVNATLASMKALEVQNIELLQDDQINARAFDRMIDLIVKHPGPVVVDNGSSSFVELSNYLVRNDAVNFLQNEFNRTVVPHSIIIGGQSYLETLDGFYQLTLTMPETVKIAVWLNDFYGPVVNDEGDEFEKTGVYAETRDRIQAILRLVKREAKTFGEDIRLMLQKRQTFGEAISDEATELMAKQRLKMTQREIYLQLGLVA